MYVGCPCCDGHKGLNTCVCNGCIKRPTDNRTVPVCITGYMNCWVDPLRMTKKHNKQLYCRFCRLRRIMYILKWFDTNVKKNKPEPCKFNCGDGPNANCRSCLRPPLPPRPPLSFLNGPTIELEYPTYPEPEERPQPLLPPALPQQLSPPASPQQLSPPASPVRPQSPPALPPQEVAFIEIRGKIDKIKERQWENVDVHEIRQEIDDLLTRMKDLPPHFRQDASFEYFLKTLQFYRHVNDMVREIKSDAWKKRHWEQLGIQLGTDLTLGQVWDLIKEKELFARQLISSAVGELPLEHYIEQVRLYWRECAFDRISSSSCVFGLQSQQQQSLKRHMDSLKLMASSPFIREFELKVNKWLECLSQINKLFVVWIDVQRRWVYLEVIFSGSADIKALLPVETSLFKSISSEFLTLMKKVSESPKVAVVLKFPNVQQQLETLADRIGEVERGLWIYLERERASFPRFYFVGDEDLLEIIGNSKNIPRLQTHFKKMFAGVLAILLNEDNNIVLGIASREGEEVIFNTPVSTIEYPKINEWLTQVEKEMKVTLALHLADAVRDIRQFKKGVIDQPAFIAWCEKYEAQIVVLAAQIMWSENVEAALHAVDTAGNSSLTPVRRVLNQVESTLTVLIDLVSQKQPDLRRRKLEHLINEFVHARTMTKKLIASKITHPKAFEWLFQMRFYFDRKHPDPLKKLSIYMGNLKFHYLFEYLGAEDRLVQTPLTDRCYLAMIQALEHGKGGSLFGPAGSGKTESIKALGHQLGRLVLVYNCDESFDSKTMDRIFVGLCRIGAWGCFDEINRLEESTLSAVSQQVQTIQEALKCHRDNQQEGSLVIKLDGKRITISQNTGLFITMNPGYLGRSDLPDNLKKLFGSLAMISSSQDRQLISEVILFSRGFSTAEKLAQQIVLFFKLCDQQFSSQSHYDFGLRALKSVLVAAGKVKGDRIQKIREGMQAQRETFIDEDAIAENLQEQEILVQSVCETMVPKLVAQDIPLLSTLLSGVFPGILYVRSDMAGLRKQIRKVCREDEFLACGKNDEEGSMWMEKVLQLYQISQLNHGIMMIGPSGSGKSAAWRVLLKALKEFDGKKGYAYVIDPKVIAKNCLFATYDYDTGIKKDGLFTQLLRKIINANERKKNKRHWIIFDGDVDTEWVENLNSVLDNNNLLVLPNGERLRIPPNVRIIFEVQDVKYATLATVSRCGIVWFSEDVVSTEMMCVNYLDQLCHVPLEDEEDSIRRSSNPSDKDTEEQLSPAMKVQRNVANIFQRYFSPNGMVTRALEHAATQLEHIMDFTRLRALSSLFSMLNQCVRNVLNYNHTHMDFPMQSDQLKHYVSKALVYAILWSFAGDGKLKARNDLEKFLRGLTRIPLPPPDMPIIDYEVSIEGEWVPWSSKVPQIEVETHEVATSDNVVPTLDTVRHESLLYTWLADHKLLVLCGPAGSGKTMLFHLALRNLPNMELVGLNFSSATSPELLLKTLDQYCEYRKTPNGMVLSPVKPDKWLVLFCDEINLPDMDKYGTQRVISLLRQMVERGGFWPPTLDGSSGEQSWVRIERIQFVGACNPPTDPGRKPLTHRFLRHISVVYVDYPTPTSLKQIYGTFNRAILRPVPSLKYSAGPLTEAMIEFYLLSQEKFTQDKQPHYVYSPREMTRWVRGIYEAIKPLYPDTTHQLHSMETLSVEDLVRLWAHEGLRLFQDRLIDDTERQWTNENIDSVALKHFPNINREESLGRPILFSNWLSKNYIPVDREDLRRYVKARFREFNEKELKKDVRLVLFDEVLDHVLRIDRVFRQRQGHLLLIGISGSGKTTLTRYVAWENGLSVIEVNVHKNYTAADFVKGLREVLLQAGCKDEKICLLMKIDDLKPGFLERINTLLANGEVLDLFEDDEYTNLMTQCKEVTQREGLKLDSADELFKWFAQQVMRNLHVVFTMNPSTEGLKDRASTSPALFNRCVLNWVGDWSDSAFFQVGMEFTNRVDLERPNWTVSDDFRVTFPALSMPPSHRDAVINATVHVHKTLRHACASQIKRGGRSTAITPRHYLDFINQFVNLYHEKRSDLEEQQLPLNVGLNKIAETVQQVEEMQKSLADKSQELQTKNEAAISKMRQVEKDKNEAEQKKIESKKIQTEIEKKTHDIAIKTNDVKADLDKVKHQFNEAQEAVNMIPSDDLAQIRRLKEPSTTIQLALEAVCFLLTGKKLTWKAEDKNRLTILSVLMDCNFKNNIRDFHEKKVPKNILHGMETYYLHNPGCSEEKVKSAFPAGATLLKWAKAITVYNNKRHEFLPLQDELTSLKREIERKKREGDEVKVLLAQLEERVQSHDSEHKHLLSEEKIIEIDLKTARGKLNRSTKLLNSLSVEKKRWEASSKNFRTQMSTIIGDTLLSSAFLAYAGYFDQQYRQKVLTKWCCHLKTANIQYNSKIAQVEYLSEYLSNPRERLQWTSSLKHAGLPADPFRIVNCILLERFNRYPLIIDPSGQAIQFIINKFKECTIIRTSLLDDAFQENLESALLTGNPILVEDVENFDPILNPILNRESRCIVSRGGENIDRSPSLTSLFLSTRDPSVEFPPDICSRVTFVNFTVTKCSLISRINNWIVKFERSDKYKQRSDLIKLKGEWHLRLRQLEKSLLQALNDAKGKILEDDSVITSLETLKQEASEVSKKVEKADKIIAEIDTISQQYMPLSEACSNIYFTLDSLSQLHFLYQHSLEYFLNIFYSVWKDNMHLKEVSDYSQRLSIVTSDIFQVVYCRVARGLLQEDRIVLSVLLCRIHLRCLNPGPRLDAEFEYLMRGKDNVHNKAVLPDLQNIGLSSEEIDALARLSKKLPAFNGLAKRIKKLENEFKQFLKHNTPELCVPVIWNPDQVSSAIEEAMVKLLAIQAVRPDRVIAASRQLVDAVFNDSFLHAGERELDLSKIVDTEVTARTPVLLCSAPGCDASGRVDDLATELNREITSIAIGSAEGLSQAKKAIDSAVKTGKWVMLKNFHLAPQWLEKKLHSLQPHPAFRLFLTTEINPNIPVNLLRACEVLVFEPPPGIRANLLRTFCALPATRMVNNERTRLYFLLAWFHAVVQERLRYCPLSWSKPYDFNESDLKVACDTLDTLIDTVALGRTNLPPEKVPWDALRTLLSQCIYGGKIDNEFDQRLMDALLSKLFTQKSFEAGFLLVSSQEPKESGSCRIVMPAETCRREQLLQWIENLSHGQHPAWLGLPNNAEKVLLTTHGTDMVTKMHKMQLLEDDDDGDETAYSASQKNLDIAGVQRDVDLPAWMEEFHDLANEWLENFPTSLVTLRRTEENIKDPLFRFFEREVNTGDKLLRDFRQYLIDVTKICQGEKKLTDYHRRMISGLKKGILPSSWLLYTIPVGTTVQQWIKDFSLRIKQLEKVSQVVSRGGARELQTMTVWLGGLFNPEAYVPATRQCVARANDWPLEELTLDVIIEDQNSKSLRDSCFCIKKLKLQGAISKNNKLIPSSEIMTDVQRICLRWIRVEGAQEVGVQSITLPVYLDADRSNVLFTVDLNVANPKEKQSFYERAVALLVI